MQESHEKQEFLIDAGKARDFTIALLKANSVPEAGATLIADCLVAADLRGVDTHGIQRLPSYIARINQGVLDPKADPTIKEVTPVVAHVDAQNGFGFLAAAAGMDFATKAAETYGISMASVTHSNHFGMSAWVVQRALRANMMSLVFTNSSPALPVYGGCEKLLGVSPIACGAPGKDGRDFILDMAPSIAARGKVYKALRRGESIPSDWALDKEGHPTTDPAAALDGGVMLPMGGPKGSALAIMMDIFSGVLSGSAFAGNVTGPYDPSKAADVGHFLVAIKPDLFMSLDDFRARMEYLYERVVSSDMAADVDRIYFPGEIEQISEKERLRYGIPMMGTELAVLNDEAKNAGIEPLRPR